MQDLKSFAAAIAQIAEERGIAHEEVIDIIESAIAAAYKKDYAKKGQTIRAKLDPASGEVKFRRELQVVDESMIYSEKELEEFKKEFKEVPAAGAESTAATGKIRFNPEKHIMLAEAKKTDAKLKPGDTLQMPLEARKDYGRIAAQTAKQVILQRIREAERTAIFNEYKAKEGQIISGILQRFEKSAALFDIGKILGILTKDEQVPGEFYRPGQRLRLYVLSVEDTSKGPSVFLSRVHPKLISKLFELEVPEVASGTVIIKSIAREAGSRTKIAVASLAEGVDPIGSMVGQRGTRVSAVISELGGEKIDIVAWSEDPKEFVANALSPAKVLEVEILPKNKALALVPEDQLSLAIGRDGQNVRLAVKVTGWKIDVRGPGQEGSVAAEGEEEAPQEEQKENAKSKPAKKIKKS